MRFYLVVYKGEDGWSPAKIHSYNLDGFSISPEVAQSRDISSVSPSQLRTFLR